MFERQLAWTDLCIFVPLALPVVGTAILDALVHWNQQLGLGGSAQAGAVAGLFVNLMGLFAVCFAVIRLQSKAGALRIHTIAIKFTAALLIAWAVTRGAPVLLMAIAIADLGAALALSLGARRA